MRYFAKVLVFCAISAATWMVTSRIIARPAEKAVARTTTTESAAVDSPAWPPNVPGLQPATGTLFMPRANLSVQQGIAHLTGIASITDIERGHVFVWRAKAMDASAQVIQSHIYMENAFELHPSGHMEPEFEDTFALPVNAKTVSLSLYAIPKEAGFAAFKDERESINHLVARSVMNVNP